MSKTKKVVLRAVENKASTRANPNRTTGAIWRASTGIAYPIAEAPQGVRRNIRPSQLDIECAIPADPTNCALAQCWMRENDVVDAQVGITTCMLPTMIDGEIVAVRWAIPAATRRVLEHFDDTGDMPAEGFELMGIAASNSLDSKRAQGKRHRVRWHEIGKAKKPRKTFPTRNASRRAQVVRDD